MLLSDALRFQNNETAALLFCKNYVLKHLIILARSRHAVLWDSQLIVNWNDLTKSPLQIKAISIVLCVYENMEF